MLELSFAGTREEFDLWSVLEDGEEVADLAVKLIPPNILRIRHIEHFAGPGAFGLTQMRQLARLIKEQYPSAEHIEGFRQSGLRKATEGRAQEIRRRFSP